MSSLQYKKIQQIATEVQSLHLIPEQADLLIVKLDTATKNLNAENTNAAANELNAFINRVNVDINSGKISPTEGKTLIDEANTVINALDPHATSVPKFPSIAVPVAAILGLVIIFGRKKE